MHMGLFEMVLCADERASAQEVALTSNQSADASDARADVHVDGKLACLPFSLSVLW